MDRSGGTGSAKVASDQKWRAAPMKTEKKKSGPPDQAARRNENANLHNYYIPAVADVQAQLRRYVECIFLPSDIVELRRLPSGRSTWHKANEVPNLAAQLLAENRCNQNVFAGINPRRQRGGRSTADVMLARVLFADFDNATTDEAMARIKQVGLPVPTLTLVSGHGLHAIWRLTEPVADLPSWTKLQKDLAALVGSDPVVCDPPRILRLPAS